MSIDKIVQDRGIVELLHFTTNLGLLGILYTRRLKSRRRLERDKQLEFIFNPNSAFRKDTAWLDYVNLSVSRINSQFYRVSSGNWHRDRDIWWCILSFSPEILSHEGVYFTTTNNIYSGAFRGNEDTTLQLLFSDKITRWYGNNVVRDNQTPYNCPTCEQAEVLYPGEVDISYLIRIYAISEADADEIQGQLAAFNLDSEIEVVVDSAKFNP